MESIEGEFVIEIDNQSVGLPENNGESRVHASLGPTSPAVFTLVDGYLKSSGWILGRSLVEDRSLLPKRVFWFDEQKSDLGLIQKTRAVSDGDSYVLEFAGAPLIAPDGYLLADLMRDEQQEVKIIMQ
ncbi:hypothetical protein N7481_002580 [Penicillium waksmanii]|uniref:uncharacterized protein n=1 Tax=Penicillium waksmanii TaxID=69791 RepID=UPI002546D83E|nr:uncharacterized protein N7481_002580 [Penicillium waksmanii]KAJ5995603.1 hypothetical protein N7481_002580 [Penicillium waksmanii]